MYRIGIVASQAVRDPASQQLLAAASRVARAELVDPISLGAMLDRANLPAPGRVRPAPKHRQLAASSAIRIGAEVAGAYDALILRRLNLRGETEFQFEALHELEAEGVLLINRPSALLIAESKFLTSIVLARAGVPVPPAAVAQNAGDLLSFLAAHRDVVVKPLYGFEGKGVVRLKAGAPGIERSIQRALGTYKAVCAQKYIENPGRDIRAFVVGQRIVAGIYRQAAPGGWKTNVHAGGRPAPCSVSGRQAELCLEASRAVGLDYTGVDLIEGPDGDCVLEVNGSPAWRGIRRVTRCDVAREIVDHVIRRLDEKASRSMFKGRQSG